MDLDNLDYSKMLVKQSSDSHLLIALLRHHVNTGTEDSDNSADGDETIDSSNNNSTTTPLDPARPRAEFIQLRQDVDRFPDPLIIDPIDKNQGAKVREGIEGMLETAKKAGFPDRHLEELWSIVFEHLEQFRVTFSPTPANIAPLDIKLKPEAHPVRVKLRKYSEEQRSFME